MLATDSSPIPGMALNFASNRSIYPRVAAGLGYFSDGKLNNGSSIQVYDLVGNLVESIDGLLFQGGDNVFPIHITLNPSRRMGFVNGPDLTTAIQSFNY